jgi:predicted DNA-binding transcriptional regulator AlpA
MSALENLMTAALGAPEERRAEALRVLKGEVPVAERKPSSGPLLIGMSRASEMLGVSRATMWRMLKRGTFEKIEILPGSYRLRRADLEAFVQNNQPPVFAKATPGQADGH